MKAKHDESKELINSKCKLCLWVVEKEKALQLCAQRPSSPQLSARTPTAECAGKVKSVTIGSNNKEKLYHIFVYIFLFYVLLGTNCKFTIYLLCRLICVMYK